MLKDLSNLLSTTAWIFNNEMHFKIQCFKFSLFFHKIHLDSSNFFFTIPTSFSQFINWTWHKSINFIVPTQHMTPYFVKVMPFPWWKMLMPPCLGNTNIYFTSICTRPCVCHGRWYTPCVSSVILSFAPPVTWPTFSFICEKNLLSLVQSSSLSFTLHPYYLSNLYPTEYKVLHKNN